MFIVQWIFDQLTSQPFELMIGVFLVVGMIEIVAPVVRVPPRHYAFNFVYAIINSLVAVAIAPVSTFSATLVVRHITPGLINLGWAGFRGVIGSLIAISVATLVFDFFYYWLHRTQHRNSILWQEHLLHHSDAYVNVTTSGRTHILEQFLFPLFISIPVAVLFRLPGSTIAVISLFPTIWAFIVHANLKISFGRFWWLFASPQYHRIHHSMETKHFDKNFAVWFPLWDIVFGTAYNPAPNEYPRTGVDGVEVKTIHDAYLLPFRRWTRMLLTASTP